MKKLYKSRSVLSVNIVLPSGYNRFISFVPSTDGGSFYMTDDEEEIWGLEHHWRYGKNIRGEEVCERPCVSENEADIESETGEDVNVVDVKDLAEAKDYLADKYGVSRTMLRGEKSIMAQAEARGVRFVFPE